MTKRRRTNRDDGVMRRVREYLRSLGPANGAASRTRESYPLADALADAQDYVQTLERLVSGEGATSTTYLRAESTAGDRGVVALVTSPDRSAREFAEATWKYVIVLERLLSGVEVSDDEVESRRRLYQHTLAVLRR